MQVYRRMNGEKSGNWSDLNPVLESDYDTRIVTLPGSNGRNVKAAFEDIRCAAINTHDVAMAVQHAIFSFTQLLDKAVCDIDNDNVDCPARSDWKKSTVPHDFSVGPVTNPHDRQHSSGSSSDGNDKIYCENNGHQSDPDEQSVDLLMFVSL